MTGGQPLGRSDLHVAALMDSGNLNLMTPFLWSIFEDSFTMLMDPDPPAY